jgi:hypothetical protein
MAAFAESMGAKGAAGFEGIYYALRHADSEKPYKNTPDIYEMLSLAMTDDKGKVRADGARDGWLWRTPERGRAGKDMPAVDRISLNVAPGVRMLKTLDDIAAADAGRAIDCFKMSDNPGSWSRRHDPVTIYMHEAPAEYKSGLIAEIGRKMSRFARRGAQMDAAVKIGKTIADGVEHEDEPNEEKIKKVVERIEKIPWLYRRVSEYLSGGIRFSSRYSNGMPVMSVGQLWMLERAADAAEKREKAKAEILKIASVKLMDKSAGGAGRARYFIPGKEADMEKLKRLLSEIGVEARERGSNLFRRTVMAQETV